MQYDARMHMSRKEELLHTVGNVGFIVGRAGVTVSLSCFEKLVQILARLLTKVVECFSAVFKVVFDALGMLTGCIVEMTRDDQELWDIITNVPELSKLVAVICAVLNCVWPGSGTVLAGLLPDTCVRV